MSLADELLADLDAIEDEETGTNQEDDDIKEAMELDENATEISSKSVRSIAKLRDSEEFQTTLKQMDEFLENPRSRDNVLGPVEVDPEYRLIVNANNLTAEIENETNIINKYCRDNYSKRFPELDSLVPNALEYIQTVQALGNDLDPNKIDNLDFLPPATRMVVSVTASTTQGVKIEEDELVNINEACQMNMDLMNAKLKIFQYVESRMSFIAPNLSVIVGASTAARVMGVAGGLTNLSKMPSCNIMLLGAQKKTLSGFSMASAQVLPHTGFIYYSEIVQVCLVFFCRCFFSYIIAFLDIFTKISRVDFCEFCSNYYCKTFSIIIAKNIFYTSFSYKQHLINKMRHKYFNKRSNM